MRSIHIKASREYDVLVERGLLDRAGELLREVSAPGMAAIVSDDTVYALYGERTVKCVIQTEFFDDVCIEEYLIVHNGLY